MGKKKTVAFIPVRGGSKSIPLKNIMPLAGKPLIYWTIEAALNCKFIDRVFVCTDSEQIKQCVSKIDNKKLETIPRSPKTATDTASSESVLLEFCENYKFENVFFIQATSPLLTCSDLEGAWDKYQNNGYNSLISTVRKKQFLWKENEGGTVTPANYDPCNRPRRQDWNGYLVENGAFYLSKRELILSSKCRVFGKTGFFEMPESSIFEIDEPSDWLIIDSCLRQIHKITDHINQTY